MWPFTFSFRAPRGDTPRKQAEKGGTAEVRREAAVRQRQQLRGVGPTGDDGRSCIERREPAATAEEPRRLQVQLEKACTQNLRGFSDKTKFQT